MNYVLAYYEEIKAGRIVVSRRVREVYKRLAREIAKPKANSPYFFDEEAGEVLQAVPGRDRSPASP